MDYVPFNRPPETFVMSRFYEPDLGAEPDSPFARDASGKLVRRGYWLDLTDRTLVMVMIKNRCASDQ